MLHPNADLKKRIIAAYQAGSSITHLAGIFGFHRNTIKRWLLLAENSSDFSRIPGSGRRSILAGQLGKKFLNIISKPASKFGFETDFWTTARIKRVCKEQLKITVSRMAIHRTLVKFEQSYKKPQKKYFEASQDKQNEWVKKELPKIKALIKKHRAILYFEDESSIDLSPVLAKTWGPIGKKIIQKVTANRGSVSAISAISSSGNLIFNIHEAGKRFCAEDIIKFLEGMLAHHQRRHLVVVMDQAPCHRAKKLLKFVASQRRLHLFYLPPRSPEFNPDEKVWSHLKHHELKSHTAKTTAELKKLTRRKMQSMARNRSKVVGIFKRCEMAHLYL